MQHPLTSLFYPKALAIIGASDRYGSAGRAVFSHLLAHQVAPIIVPINPSHKTVGGCKSYPSLTDAVAENPIDTAIVILSADKIGSIVREAAKAHVENVIFINELEQPSPHIHNKLHRAAELAHKLGVKLLALPANGLQGLFQAAPHKACAYIGQSLSIADCMQRYAEERGITFSRFLTLNPQNYPISTGQIIDFIAAEPNTSALLIHISVLDNSRELLSALKAAAQHKPIVVLSTLPETQQETLFAHALSRHQILTVPTLTQFFTAANLIHTGITRCGKRLAIVSNTPQISALTLKTLPQTDLVLADLSANTAHAINKITPHKTKHTNPLYLPADSAPSIFQAAVSQILQDDHTDAVFLLYVGQNTADNQRMAKMVAKLQQHSHKPLLLTWLGSADTPEIRQIFNQHNNLHFRQPEHALHALSQLNAYRQHQQQRHQLHDFYDYRYAIDVANELHKYLRPLLPVGVLPTTKSTLAIFLSALKLGNQLSSKKQIDNPLTLSWEKHDTFGQILTLRTTQKSLPLLPPLTPNLAENALRELDLPAVIWQDWLLNTAEILSRLPEIHSTQLDIYHDVKRGLMCHDAKLNLQMPDDFSGSLNTFTPYPTDAEQQITLSNGLPVAVRPVRPEDATLLQRLFSEQSENSRYNRFMMKNNALPTSLIAKLSTPDYQREFALIMHDEHLTPLATAHYVADFNGVCCEFGITVADSLQGQGVGTWLLTQIIEHAKQQGFAAIRAEILASNLNMQKLAVKLGFALTVNPHDSSVMNAYLALK